MYLKEIRKIIVVKESKLKRFLILDDFGLKRVIPDIPSCNFEQTSQNKHPKTNIPKQTSQNKHPKTNIPKQTST
jgi:hypothetical protein